VAAKADSHAFLMPKSYRPILRVGIRKKRDQREIGKREMTTVSEKIDAKQVKALREMTGAPMGDCKKALEEAKGDLEAAIVVLRKRGMASAQKKAARSTNEGAVGTYIHAGGKIGVLIELNCESDFVALTNDFQELLKDIAMHIAASDPRYVKPEDVTIDDLEREKEIYRAQAALTGKPAAVIERILDGKMAKFYEEVCLLEQPFIKDQAVSIKELIATKVGKLGENITVRRFARFKVGAPDWTVAQTKSVETPGE
jgi:elongation factor Ts